MPLKRSLKRVLSLSAILGLVTITACLGGNHPTNTGNGIFELPQTTPRVISPAPVKPQEPLKTKSTGYQSGYDWTSTRVIGNEGGFSTQSFADKIKAKLDIPAREQQQKTVVNTGEFTNDFAKTVSGLEEGVTLPSTPAVLTADNTAYFLTESTSSANFYKLNKNGQVVWELSLHDSNGRFAGTSPVLGKAKGEDLVYAISDKGRLYAISTSNGLVKAFTDINDTFQYTSPYVVIDEAGTPADNTDDTDRVFLASQTGKVYEHQFNGTSFTRTFEVTVATTTDRNRFNSSPVITGSKTAPGEYIYLGSDEGKLYKLQRTNGTVVSNVDLTTLSRSAGCQIKGTLTIDVGLDVGLVPCGGYLFRVELKNAIPTTDFNFPNSAQMAVTAQSPLLELRNLQLFKPTQALRPNHQNRTQVSTSILRDPKPTEGSFSVEQPFGFASRDFVRVDLKTGDKIYGAIDKVDKDKITIKDDLFPLPSPTPDPLLEGTEKVTLANQVVRSSPAPTQLTPAVPGDAATRFTAGSVKELKDGDFIFFPALGSFTGFQICASGNTSCDDDGSLAPLVGKPYLGINRDTNEVVVPGTALFSLLNGKGTVAFEKVQNRVIVPTSSTKFSLGDATGIQAGDVIRVTHQNGDIKGRYEYAVVDSVNGREITLTAGTALLNRPENGDWIFVVDINRGYFGRVFQSLDQPTSDITSSPILRGGASKLVYIHHGNVVYEIDYNSTQNFSNSANYMVLQAGRLDHGNLALNATPRSTPLILPVGSGLIGDRLYVTDTDPSGKTGIFMNRILLPLNSTLDRLNDSLAISAPNGLGHLSQRAETNPMLIDTDFILFGGGNGIAYKRHKDKAW